MSTAVSTDLQPPTPVADALAARSTPYRGAIVVGVAALITPVGYFGNEGISPLVALGGLLTLPLMFRLKVPALGVWIITALTLWAAVSFAWSPLEPAQLAHLHGYNHLQALTAPKLIFQLILYSAFLDAALRLSPDWRRRALWVLALSVLATVAVLVVEGLEGGMIYERLSEMVGQHWSADLAQRNAARGSYGAVVLFWPAAAVLWRRHLPGAAIAAFVGGVVSALMLGVDAPAMALVVALGAFLVVRYGGRLGVLACLAATTIYFALTPLLFMSRTAGATLPTDVGKLSWHIRLDIWRFATTQILQRPLFGWGLDSSRNWPNQIPMHPHDASIQLWLETGLVGVALAALFFAWLFWRIDKVEAADRDAAAIMAATTAAYLTIGAISFGVWQEWWIALGVFAIAACQLLARARAETGVVRPASDELIPLDMG
ncbi:MAG: O-antigen ligase family protein [Caulobacteraceae bacterium]